jgi:hypothetical protein
MRSARATGGMLIVFTVDPDGGSLPPGRADVVDAPFDGVRKRTTS